MFSNKLFHLNLLRLKHADVNNTLVNLCAREMRSVEGDDFSFCVSLQLPSSLLPPPSSLLPPTEDPINLPAIKFVN